MKLYMHPVSTTSRPVRLFIADHGIEVEEVVIDLMTGEDQGAAGPGEEGYAAIRRHALLPPGRWRAWSSRARWDPSSSC